MDVQPNKIAYVTGCSRGIGMALTEALLAADYVVYGLARTNSLDHPRFHFIMTDLTQLDALGKIEFQSGKERTVLLNNAGVLGEVMAVGDMSDDSLVKTAHVNTLAPQILMNQLLNRFKNENGQFQILNISSGAAKRPIAGWAAYCASKAALDLFSETVAEELDWKGHVNWFIHSCAPGVVDTEMQEEIRNTSAENFKQLESFVALKSNGELAETKAVAAKLMRIIEEPALFPDVVLSVRDFE